MEPGAKSNVLLYVSNFYGSDVTVYSYPKGGLVGTLTGFGSPTGVCSDSQGNVFITDYADADIVEFAHGGTTPIATLSDSGLRPEGCSVDPTTGNLAVSNLETNGFLHGDLAIYPNASGTPEMYTNPNFFYYFFCAYDNAGNLYVDGLGPQSVNVSQVAKLAAGGSKLKSVTFDASILDAEGISWDGKYLAIGVQMSGETIDRYRISGTTGTLIGSAAVDGSEDLLEFWIGSVGRDERTILIGPNFDGNDITYYQYPDLGNPFKTIRHHRLHAPYGLTISRAQ
jgi:hypothetical protein